MMTLIFSILFMCMMPALAAADAKDALPDSSALKDVLSEPELEHLRALCDTEVSSTTASIEDGDALGEAKDRLLALLENQIRIAYARTLSIEPASLSAELAKTNALMQAAGSADDHALVSLVKQWAVLNGLLNNNIAPDDAKALTDYVATFIARSVVEEAGKGFGGAGASELYSHDAERLAPRVVVPVAFVEESLELGLSAYHQSLMPLVTEFKRLAVIYSLECKVLAYLAARIDLERKRGSLRTTANDAAYLSEEQLEKEHRHSESFLLLLNELIQTGFAHDRIKFNYLACGLGMPLRFSLDAWDEESQKQFSEGMHLAQAEIKAVAELFIRTRLHERVEPFLINLFRKKIAEKVSKGEMKRGYDESRKFLLMMSGAVRINAINDHLDRIEATIVGCQADEKIIITSIMDWFNSEYLLVMNYGLWPSRPPVFCQIDSEIVQIKMPKVYRFNLLPETEGTPLKRYKKTLFNGMCCGVDRSLFIDTSTVTPEHLVQRLLHSDVSVQGSEYAQLWLLLDVVELFGKNYYIDAADVEYCMRQQVPEWSYQKWRVHAVIQAVKYSCQGKSCAQVYRYLIDHLPSVAERQERELQAYLSLADSFYTPAYWKEHSQQVQGGLLPGDKELSPVNTALLTGNIDTDNQPYVSITSPTELTRFAEFYRQQDDSFRVKIAHKEREIAQLTQRSLVQGKRENQRLMKADPIAAAVLHPSSRAHSVATSAVVTKAILAGQKKVAELASRRIEHLKVCARLSVVCELKGALTDGDAGRFDSLAAEYGVPFRLSAVAALGPQRRLLGPCREFLQEQLLPVARSDFEYWSLRKAIAVYEGSAVADRNIASWQLLLAVYYQAEAESCLVDECIQRHESTRGLWGDDGLVNAAIDSAQDRQIEWQRRMIAFEQDCGITRDEDDDMPRLRDVMDVEEPGFVVLGVSSIPEEGLSTKKLEYKKLRTLNIVADRIQNLLEGLKEERARVAEGAALVLPPSSGTESSSGKVAGAGRKKPSSRKKKK